jgi:L-ascorbate metabolism protein UlaG (beta-lactamase superfamily)
VVVDPYLSRVPDSAHAISDPAAVAAHGPTRADLIVVGHGHGFSVRVLASLHSATGLAAGGDVATFAYLLRLDGATVLVFDTANFDERTLEGIHPDVAIVATGLRERIHDYTCRLVHVLGNPRVVLPTHFDDFRAPPGTPLATDSRVDLDAFARELHACAPTTRFIVPTAFARIRVGVPSPD